MKVTSIIILLIALTAKVLATPLVLAPLDGIDRMAQNDMETVVRGPTTLCREYSEPVRCVDEPLKILDNEPWCPYRLCAPKFVVADACPTNHALKATSKCRFEWITRDIYKCDEKQFADVNVPQGCTIGSEGCRKVPACSCFKVPNVRSDILKEITGFSARCNRE